VTKGNELYKKWHWGVDATVIKDWNDPDVDSVLGPDNIVIETGRLVELHFREPHKRKDTIVKLDKDEANGSHLVFDPDHHSNRLYIYSQDGFKERMRERYLSNGTYKGRSRYQDMPLKNAAKIVGGRHATDDYPNLDVVPIGILTHVVYATEKTGDGYSFYIHKLGEESGINPALTISEDGRLWIAGGNYTSPEAGITD
jgi:hypothetical protein